MGKARGIKKRRAGRPANMTAKNKKTAPVKQATSREYLPFFIILVACFLAYIPVLKAGFVNWDDPDYANEVFFKKGFSNLLTTPIQGNYHPLTVLSLFLNYLISGMNAWSYHLLNVILHMGNCILVFRLILLLSRGSVLIAFITAILFGIHPMHVESVAWVSERKDVLYGLFFIAGLISYTKFVDTGNRKQYVSAILFF